MSLSSNTSCEATHDCDRLCIFGAGGFGREVAWLVQQTWGKKLELFFAVDKPAYAGGETNGIPVVLTSNIVNPEGFHYVAAVGSPALRRSAVRHCEQFGMQATQIVHPRTEKSSLVEIGLGSIICAGCIITTNIIIGAHVHVNLACTIGHDVHIGDYTTISPGCHISGNVHIGSDVFIGTGAVIINGTADSPLTIGDGAVIAANACVLRSVEAGTMVAGVPAVTKR